jgi:endogenous inhibitor of DNA gyrase (YacG/DUF329 family)
VTDPREAPKTGCPICGKAPAPAFKPFCSSRCADVDLHRWLSGVYRVETDEAPEGGIPTEAADKDKAV